MSSINHFPTFEYSQPEAYHFSHDSVFLAREIFERHRSLLKERIRILDLCAGCGIVGLDLLFHQLKEEKEFQGEMDFLEVQNIYQAHFEANLKTLHNHFLSQSLKTNWIEQNYANAISKKKYDLIISNPPYFLTEQGKLSNNDFKNRCRFFIDSDWKTLIQFIKSSLTEKGQAYFLVREELKELLQKETSIKVDFPFQIRGTWVAFLKSESI